MQTSDHYSSSSDEEIEVFDDIDLVLQIPGVIRRQRMALTVMYLMYHYLLQRNPKSKCNGQNQ